MGIFKDRSNYFKQLAINNKSIAHTKVVDGEQRVSFFRLNDEEELQAACANWMHFPCVNHFGFDGRYAGPEEVVKRKLSNDLLFLSKALATDMDGIEDAYDEAFEAMEKWLSRMEWEYKTQGSCGPFSVFDPSRCSFVRYKLDGNLFGWLLSFEDEKYADEINKYNPNDWFDANP